MVEEACRLNVKWSLQELSKAINGDGKTAPNSLFKVNTNSFYFIICLSAFLDLKNLKLFTS